MCKTPSEISLQSARKRHRKVWTELDNVRIILIMCWCLPTCSILDKQEKKKQKKTSWAILKSWPWWQQATEWYYGRKQLGDITDYINIALANTNMPFDFEPPTTSTTTKHITATARELYTPAKLITCSCSIVDMATSPFAHSRMLHPLPNNNYNKNPQEPDTGQGSLPYSNLLSEIKWVLRWQKHSDPQNKRTTTDLKSIINVYLATKAKTVVDEN